VLLDQPPAGVPEGRRRRAVQVQQADVGHGGEQLPGQLARGDVRRGPDQALLAPGGEQLAELDQGLFDGVQELGAGGPAVSPSRSRRLKAWRARGWSQAATVCATSWRRWVGGSRGAVSLRVRAAWGPVSRISAWYRSCLLRKWAYSPLSLRPAARAIARTEAPA
jgi:hypothetical protein